MLTTLLVKYWRVLAVLVMVAGLFAFGKMEQIEKNEWKSRAESMKAENLALGRLLDQQNAAIREMQAAAKRAEDEAQAKLKAAQARAARVQVQWKTQYVPVKVPTQCASAVSAGAQNAAQIGKLFMQTP